MMDHAEATRKYAAEQYLLGELSEPEREEFERHFFGCEECAETLETAATLVENAKAIFREPAASERRVMVRERRRWFSFAGWGFAPAAALAGCAILAVLVGYQNLVQIPKLRSTAVLGELVMSPAISVRAARAEKVLTFSKRNGIMSVTVAHEWEETYSRYEGEIERAADHRVISKAQLAATPGDITVTTGVRPLESGSYFLTVYGLRGGSSERTPVARVPLTITE